MTYEDDVKKARLEYDVVLNKAKKEFDDQYRKVVDKAELKHNKKITELKKIELQRQNLEYNERKIK